MKTFSGLAVVILLAGCATGAANYVAPELSQTLTNEKIVNKPREAVWNASVPELGKRFFVINNLDKSSGLINMSYSGDPESYLDCGRVTSTVKNARGERTYDFPGSRAQETYELLNGNALYIFDRKMSMDGRVNLVFEETGPSQTRVTANTRYVVERTNTSRNVGSNIPQTRRDSISFNAGSKGTFPGGAGKPGTECVSTGKLEREILSVIH